MAKPNSPSKIKLNFSSKEAVFNDYLLKYDYNGNEINFLEDYTTRNFVLWGGGGSGKTWGIWQKLLIKACTYDDTRIFAFRKELASVRNTIWNNLVMLLKEWGLYNVSHINNTNYEVTLPNGAFITCKGLDKRKHCSV